MGNKLTARDTMKNVGVPTVPGSDGYYSTEEGIKLAYEIGFPVMIKVCCNIILKTDAYGKHYYTFILF
ncbi:putative biotin carboxylase [Helianthus annuus]|nr:putative biotin carboxylase [Helianthus annuus]